MSRVDTKNPSLFAAMQEPHESVEALNVALDAFLEEVGAAREKHRIAEVLTVCSVLYLGQDGQDVDAMMVHFYGDQTHAESVSAYAYGRYAAMRQEQISSLIKQATLLAPKSKK